MAAIRNGLKILCKESKSKVFKYNRSISEDIFKPSHNTTSGFSGARYLQIHAAINGHPKHSKSLLSCPWRRDCSKTNTHQHPNDWQGNVPYSTSKRISDAFPSNPIKENTVAGDLSKSKRWCCRTPRRKRILHDAVKKRRCPRKLMKRYLPPTAPREKNHKLVMIGSADVSMDESKILEFVRRFMNAGVVMAGRVTNNKTRFRSYQQKRYYNRTCGKRSVPELNAAVNERRTEASWNKRVPLAVKRAFLKNIKKITGNERKKLVFGSDFSGNNFLGERNKTLSFSDIFSRRVNTVGCSQFGMRASSGTAFKSDLQFTEDNPIVSTEYNERVAKRMRSSDLPLEMESETQEIENSAYERIHLFGEVLRERKSSRKEDCDPTHSLLKLQTLKNLFSPNRRGDFTSSNDAVAIEDDPTECLSKLSSLRHSFTADRDRVAVDRGQVECERKTLDAVEWYSKEDWCPTDTIASVCRKTMCGEFALYTTQPEGKPMPMHDQETHSDGSREREMKPTLSDDFDSYEWAFLSERKAAFEDLDAAKTSKNTPINAGDVDVRSCDFFDSFSKGLFLQDADSFRVKTPDNVNEKLSLTSLRETVYKNRADKMDEDRIKPEMHSLYESKYRSEGDIRGRSAPDEGTYGVGASVKSTKAEFLMRLQKARQSNLESLSQQTLILPKNSTGQFEKTSVEHKLPFKTEKLIRSTSRYTEPERDACEDWGLCCVKRTVESVRSKLKSKSSTEPLHRSPRPNRSSIMEAGETSIRSGIRSIHFGNFKPNVSDVMFSLTEGSKISDQLRPTCQVFSKGITKPLMRSVFKLNSSNSYDKSFNPNIEKFTMHGFENKRRKRPFSLDVGLDNIKHAKSNQEAEKELVHETSQNTARLRANAITLWSERLAKEVGSPVRSPATNSMFPNEKMETLIARKVVSESELPELKTQVMCMEKIRGETGLVPQVSDQEVINDMKSVWTKTTNILHVPTVHVDVPLPRFEDECPAAESSGMYSRDGSKVETRRVERLEKALMPRQQEEFEQLSKLRATDKQRIEKDIDELSDFRWKYKRLYRELPFSKSRGKIKNSYSDRLRMTNNRSESSNRCKLACSMRAKDYDSFGHTAFRETLADNMSRAYYQFIKKNRSQTRLPRVNLWWRQTPTGGTIHNHDSIRESTYLIDYLIRDRQKMFKRTDFAQTPVRYNFVN